MIRILHSVSNMDRAGLETMLMNYYRNIDREKIQFDFLCNKQKPGDYDEEIISLGGRIYRAPGLNPLKYLKYRNFMKDLFKNNKYDIIHAHNEALAAYALKSAKDAKIPIRIFHAHSSKIDKNYKFPIKVICKWLLPRVYNYKCSCGKAASEFYFGKDYESDVKHTFIRNAVDVDKYKFNEAIQKKIRDKYNLNGKFVIGHFARFTDVKNHDFLIDVFNEFSQGNDNSMLILAGDGDLFFDIKYKVESLNLSNKVIFLGNVDNLYEWYQAIDVFVLPSKFEGLPVVGVEAQAAGLPCVFSQKVSNEIKLTDNVFFKSIDSIGDWVEEFNRNNNFSSRKDTELLISSKGYNIKLESKKLFEYYLSLINSNIKVQ